MKFNIYFTIKYATCVKHLHYINSILDIFVIIIKNLIYIYLIYDFIY